MVVFLLGPASDTTGAQNSAKGGMPHCKRGPDLYCRRFQKGGRADLPVTRKTSLIRCYWLLGPIQ